MGTLELLGTALGIGFLAGMRLYATVLAIGLGIRWGIFRPSEELSELAVLADWRVLAAAGAAYLIEFVADKIPWVDSFWDSIHTVIRPVGAGLLAFAALGELDPLAKWLLVILCGGVALTGHSAKAATRLVINHSPEPFSNVAMSTFEDILTPLGVWFVIAHPVAALALLIAVLVVFVWLSRKVYRLIRGQFTALAARVRGAA